jgi:hypothetical protein
MPTDIALEAAAPVVLAADIPATAEDERALGWTCGVIVVITLVLALFSAASMKSWAETLAPTPTNAVIRQAAEGWYDFTDHLGLTAPRAGLRSVWKGLRDARFGGGDQTDPTIQR